MEDENILLYKAVIDHHLPSRLLTISDGQVLSIQEAVLDQVLWDKFSTSDLLMGYFEAMFLKDIDNIELWKSCIIKDCKIANFDCNDYTYSSTDLLKRYKQYTKNPNKEIIEYFDSHDDLFYKEDIELLIKRIANTGNVVLLESFYTEEECDFTDIENSILESDFIEAIKYFQQKIDDQEKYDSKSFLEAYKEWLKNIERLTQIDIHKAERYNELEKWIEGVEVTFTRSPEHLDKLIKIYKPKIGDRLIDQHDGLDLFNNAVLNHIDYLVYRHPQHTYYKVKEDISSLINISDNIPINTMHFTIPNQLLVDYNLTDNRLQIQHMDKMSMDDSIINTILPDITLGVITDSLQSGHFNFWNCLINENELKSQLLINPLLNTVFFINDNKWSHKDIYLKYSLFGKQMSTIILSQQFYDKEHIVEKQLRDNVVKDKLKKGKNPIPYVLVKYKNVQNLDRFVTILGGLLAHVSGSYDNFNKLIHDISQKDERDIDVKLIRLRSLMPNAFIEGYTGFCDTKKRPTPIAEEDVKGYIGDKLKSIDKSKHMEFKKYGVMQFHDIQLVCDDDEYIYPRLKETKNAKMLNELDKETYPYLPCCGKTPQKEEKTEKKTFNHIESVTGALANTQTGNLKDNIERFLSAYNKESNNQFQRIGVKQDYRSLLRCVMKAKKVKDIDMVMNLINNQVHFAVAKQECYNMTVMDIKQKFNQQIDSAYHYRILEEYFDINLYILSPSIDGMMEIPNYARFLVRPERIERPTVVVYKQGDVYELIFNKSDSTLLFETTMSAYCHDYLNQLLASYTFDISNVYDINILVYKNLYRYAEHLKYFNQQPVGQTVDEYGKVRYFHFTVGDETLSLQTIPSQPENLPLISNISSCNIEIALKVMSNEPTGQVTKDEKTIGLYFPLFDLRFGEFIPIRPVKKLDLMEGPSLDVFLQSGVMRHQTYQEVKRILNFLLQILYWIYHVALDYDVVEGRDDFFLKYVMIGDVDYTRILNIPRRFPIFQNFEDYIKYLDSYGLIKEDQFLIESELLYTRIYQEFVYYERLNIEEDIIFIPDYYKYVDNFDKQDNTLIFIDAPAMLVWKNYRNFSISKTIKDIHEVYAYMVDNPAMFLIQNVKSGILEDALYLISYWHKHKINLGFKAKGKVKKVNPNIYMVTEDKQLKLVKKGDDNYNVIDYTFKPNKVGKYGAMLYLI